MNNTTGIFKPFEYRVINSDNHLEIYTGGFDTKEIAEAWYGKHGVWLEKNLDRTLVLIENKPASAYEWTN